LKVPAPGSWTFVVGPEFEIIDNGDSVQAVHGERIVYVSCLAIGAAQALVPAAALRASAAKRFGSGQRFSHLGESVQGDAEAFLDDQVWRLRGTMCAEGTLATCLIDFSAPADLAWAVEVWKSLSCDEEPG
jgi:hypothetical protein